MSAYYEPPRAHEVSPKPRRKCCKRYQENECDDHEDRMDIDEVRVKLCFSDILAVLSERIN